MGKNRAFILITICFVWLGGSLAHPAESNPFSSIGIVEAPDAASCTTETESSEPFGVPAPSRDRWFVPGEGFPLDLSRDYQWFLDLTRAVDATILEFEWFMIKVSKKQPLSVEEETQIGRCFVAALQIHSSLVQLANRLEDFKKTPGLSLAQQEALSRLSFGAFAEWYRLVCYLAVRAGGKLVLKTKMNEAIPELDIPEGKLDELAAILGDGKLRGCLSDGFEEFWKLARARGTTTDFFEARVKWDRDYIDRFAPGTLLVKVRNLGRAIGDTIYGGFYQINVSVSTWIGDHKYLPKRHAITAERVAQATSLLLPGDILVERKNWYLSNLFLPGFWKHGLMYCGTVADLERLGLTSDPVVARHLAAYQRPDRKGRLPRVLESISEGVVPSSLEEALEGDYVAAFRPRLSEERIKSAIRNAFSHFGKPYDFDFNFQTADKIVCTELIYRSFREKLPFTLRKFMGRWILSADDLVKMFADERAPGKPVEDRNFDFVCFIDSKIGSGKTKFKSETDLIRTLKRSSTDPWVFVEE